MTADNLIFTDTLPDAFAAAGMPWPGEPEPGKRKRFSTNPKKPTDKSGWLSVFPDGDGAVFGCWRESQTFTWQRKRNGPEPTPAEREAWKQQADTLRRAALAEREAEYQTAASQARAIWQAGKPLPPDFAYLAKKGIRPHIARLSHDGRLMVPVHGQDGEIQSLQFIGADGSKRFHFGGRMAGGWCLLGTVRANEPILLAEGFATAATLHEATGKPVFCALSAGNLLPIAEMLKARYPAAVRVICGDDDRETQGNPGRTKATAASEATGARVAFPTFASQTGKDFNDMAQEAGPDAVRQSVESALRQAQKMEFTAPPITKDELTAARASPSRIVDSLFYADVGTLIAPGGVGKTTLMLHVAAHIVIGRDVFGETVRKPGPVLLVTAEDSREILVARLRAVMDTMGLDDTDRAAVMAGVRIADVSGGGFKLTEVRGDVVMPSDRIDAVIAAAMEIEPVLIVIDPAVSFGVGEQRVNDAEQGLIEAGRRLRNALECCILYVHHSGKANAREKNLDQYSGRGGSAFADGSRMVHVLQNLTHDEWRQATGREFDIGETGLILARPKMSYCPPPGDIYISRRGYDFERIEPATVNKQAIKDAQANQVFQLLTDELKHGRFHTKNSLEHADHGLTRAQLRAALSLLDVTGRVETRQRPDAGQRGSRDYLHPVGSPMTAGEASPETVENDDTASPVENDVFGSPPYREMIRRRSEPPISSPDFLASPATTGEAAANPANREYSTIEPETVEEEL